MSETKRKTMAECIEDGVKLLDEKRPGWLEKIDLSRLRLDEHCNCVLGQCFGDYEEACGRLGLFAYRNEDEASVSATQFGFMSNRLFRPVNDDIEYFEMPALQEAWIRRLIQLKQERGIA